MNVFSKLKKKLAMGSLATVSIFYPMENKAQAEEIPQQSTKIEFYQNVAKSLKIINETDAGFKDLLISKLNQLQQTDIGKNLLANCPKNMTLIIREKPEGVDLAGYFDGQNCVIYDDTLLSMSGDILLAHEIRHAIQNFNYQQDYRKMPTEQTIIYNKMIEVETRLQDVLLKEEMIKKKIPPYQTPEFQSSDLMDYLRLKQKIISENPNLSETQIDKMARTQFVIDTWQNNQRDIYDSTGAPRSLKEWTKAYNSQAIQGANNRNLSFIPRPNLSVDEGKISRHHEIMKEFISRMNIDIPDTFFDTLDKSNFEVIRSPKKLAEIKKLFDKDVAVVVIPKNRDSKVGGILVGKDNSTTLFTPEQRKTFQKNEISSKKALNSTSKHTR